jgi:hypothetical protein
MNEKQLRILNLTDQLIHIFKERDEDKKLNKELQGDTWEVHNIKLLKELIEDYFGNEK